MSEFNDLEFNTDVLNGSSTASAPSVFDTPMCMDADLTNWESRMPALAQKMNVYAGKRQLAKNFIIKSLLKRGVDPATITDPSQLCDAAVFKELELIFRDLDDNPDSISHAKASHYEKLFIDELELVILYVTTDTGEVSTVKPTISSIPLLRA